MPLNTLSNWKYSLTCYDTCLQTKFFKRVFLLTINSSQKQLSCRPALSVIMPGFCWEDHLLSSFDTRSPHSTYDTAMLSVMMRLADHHRTQPHWATWAGCWDLSSALHSMISRLLRRVPTLSSNNRLNVHKTLPTTAAKTHRPRMSESVPKSKNN